MEFCPKKLNTRQTFLPINFHIKGDPLILEYKSISYDDYDEDNVDHDNEKNENNDVKMSLEEGLLPKIYNQIETFQNDSLKYWLF